MEVILLIIVWLFFGWIIKAIKTAGKAGLDTVQGKGSFTDNFKSDWKGMESLQIKAEIVQQELEDGKSVPLLECKIKGLLPNTSATHMTSVLSIFTKDKDGKWMPVTSALDSWQEEETPVYAHKQDMGYMQPNMGFRDWIMIGNAFTQTLTPGWSGRQTAKCVLYILDKSLGDEVRFGFPSNQSAVIDVYETTITIDFEGQGYIEASENEADLKPLAVSLAVAVANADGDFADSEGFFIKNWIKKQLTMVADHRVDRVKEQCNQAMQETYQQSAAGELSISSLTSKINELAGEADKYEIIELCLDVMAADGEADESEMDLIWKIASSLGLDKAEVNKIKDKKIVSLNVSGSAQSDSLNQLLGIDPNWTVEEKKKHLNKEFSKWNSRLHTVTDQAGKENVQRMLDAISEARKQLS